MVADDQRRTVAVVRAVEGLEQTVTHLVSPVLVLVRVSLRRPGLVEHEVVVHRQRLEGAPGDRDELHGEIPDPALLLRPHLVVDAAGVVAEPHGAGRLHHVLPALQARGASADQLLVVVEGKRLLGLEDRVIRPPALDEGLRLTDLALPFLYGPGPDATVVAAEMAVEVGADLVPVLPGAAQLSKGVPDSLGVVEADVRAAGVVLGRVVPGPLPLREQVHAAEEVRHRGVVLLAHLTEVREEPLTVLSRSVPREHHELRGLLSRRQALHHRLLGLNTRERGGPVTNGSEHGLGRRFRGLLLLARGPVDGSETGGLRSGARRAPGRPRDQRNSHDAQSDPLRGGHHPPTSFSQVACAECRHGAAKVARTVERLARQAE